MSTTFLKNFKVAESLKKSRKNGMFSGLFLHYSAISATTGNLPAAAVHFHIT